jgi:hypothetical protein
MLNINDSLYGSNIRPVQKKKKAIKHRFVKPFAASDYCFTGWWKRQNYCFVGYSQCFTLHTERPKSVMVPNVPYLCIKEYYYGV